MKNYKIGDTIINYNGIANNYLAIESYIQDEIGDPALEGLNWKSIQTGLLALLHKLQELARALFRKLQEVLKAMQKAASDTSAKINAAKTNFIEKKNQEIQVSIYHYDTDWLLQAYTAFYGAWENYRIRMHDDLKGDDPEVDSTSEGIFRTILQKAGANADMGSVTEFNEYLQSNTRGEKKRETIGVGFIQRLQSNNQTYINQQKQLEKSVGKVEEIIRLHSKNIENTINDTIKRIERYEKEIASRANESDVTLEMVNTLKSFVTSVFEPSKPSYYPAERTEADYKKYLDDAKKYLSKYREALAKTVSLMNMVTSVASTCSALLFEAQAQNSAIIDRLYNIKKE